MYEFSSIFIYFLSIVIVISAMTFVVLMTLVHEVSRRRHLLTLVCFCACNFLIQLLYIGMTIQDVLIKYYRYSMPLRIADIVLYTLQAYLWCRYLLYYPLKSTFAAKHGKKLCYAVTAIALVLGIYNYAFNIDNEFLYENAYAVMIELTCTILVSIMLVLTTLSLKRGANKRFDNYNIAITALLIFIQWSTDISMILETKVGFSFSAHEYLTGSLQQVALTLILVLYVYRTDYSGATLRGRLRELVASNKAAQATGDSAGSGDASAAFVLQQSAAGEDGVVITSSADKVKMPGGAIDTDESEPSADRFDDNESNADAIGNDHAPISDMPSLINAENNIGRNADIMAGHTADMNKSVVNGNNSDNTIKNPSASEVSSASETAMAAEEAEDPDPIEALFTERQLTPREREVARLAYTGLTNPEIADKLCISQYTVKRHMHAVFEKLGISARIELVHLLSGH